MHLSTVLLALALAAQSPPVPAASPPTASAQAPAKTQPTAAPPQPAPPVQYVLVMPAPRPSDTGPPHLTGRFVPAPEPPVQPPVQYVAVQPYQYLQAPQPAVYAAPAPVQTAQQVAYVTAQPPTQIQFGGGLISAGLTRVGQCLVHLGSTRTTITLQRTSTRVGMPGPVQTAQYTTTYQVPVQAPQVQIVQQQPVYQPVAVQQPPPSEAAPPPPPAPTPTPSSQSAVPAPRRIGDIFRH